MWRNFRFLPRFNNDEVFSRYGKYLELVQLWHGIAAATVSFSCDSFFLVGACFVAVSNSMSASGVADLVLRVALRPNVRCL